MEKNNVSAKINWFPGHMKKTIGEIREKLKIVDVVIYVLDSRAYFFNQSKFISS